MIIQLFKNFSDLRVEGDRLYVQAGTLLSRTAKKALEASLTGFEFAAGIPGTIGGAMVMNAGAYGGEMKDVTEEVTVLTEEGEVKTLKREELKMGYRTSRRITPMQTKQRLDVPLSLKSVSDSGDMDTREW